MIEKNIKMYIQKGKNQTCAVQVAKKGEGNIKSDQIVSRPNLITKLQTIKASSTIGLIIRFGLE